MKIIFDEDDCAYFGIFPFGGAGHLRLFIHLVFVSVYSEPTTGYYPQRRFHDAMLFVFLYHLRKTLNFNFLKPLKLF